LSYIHPNPKEFLGVSFTKFRIVFTWNLLRYWPHWRKKIDSPPLYCHFV